MGKNHAYRKTCSMKIVFAFEVTEKIEFILQETRKEANIKSAGEAKKNRLGEEDSFQQKMVT